jgi:glycosyltransferase involved in cell wall biosynthesis
MPSLSHLASHPSARDPYDLIIVARRDAYAAAAPLLSRAYPTTPVAFDTVDLHFAREAQRRAFFTAHAGEPDLLAAVFGPAAAAAANDTTGAAEHAAMRKRELRAAAGSTAAVVVSERERGALMHELRAEGYIPPPVVVIANAHEPAPLTPAPFGERAGVVFVGNFNHLPNRDAVLFFANHVLPLILTDPRAAQDPGFVFHVIGSNRIPDAILQLNNTAAGPERGGGGDSATTQPRIFVHGYVDDLRPLYGRMRLSVAPLRWGAGVKGKINTAHQLGVPVVCTPVAADGMHAVHGRDVLVADGADAFARHTLAAYYNASLWRRLQAGGRRLLARRFSASRATVGLFELLARLRNASVPLASKTLGLRSPRHRAYVDLRAAAALGGYYFNFTRLDDHLAISNDRVGGEAAACTAARGQQLAARVRAVPGSTYYLSVVGSHSGSVAAVAASPAVPGGEAEGSYDPGSYDADAANAAGTS